MTSSNTALESALRAAITREIPGARGIANLHALSGGASQETWAFDALCLESALPLVLRRESAGAGERAGANAGLENEAALIRLAAENGIPVPQVRYVLAPEDRLGRGFIMGRIDGETIARKILREPQFDKLRPIGRASCRERV